MKEVINLKCLKKDYETINERLEVLKEMASNGKYVIAVSHSDEIFGYADEHLELENGKLIEGAYEK